MMSDDMNDLTERATDWLLAYSRKHGVSPSEAGAAALSRSDPASARMLDLLRALDDIRICAELDPDLNPDGWAA